MHLGAWNTVWLGYVFDRDRGSYSRRLRLRPHASGPISGVGAVERTLEFGKVFFCVYLWGGKVFFQAGQRRWRLDSTNLRFDLQANSDSRELVFRTFESGSQVFQASYRPRKRTARARLDVSYDRLDVELDHLLAHVAAMSLPAIGFEAWRDGSAAEPGVEPDGRLGGRGLTP
jgi:hypothetical protein